MKGDEIVADPCTIAEDIGDPHRSVDYVPTEQDVLICDEDVNEGEFVT